MSTAHQICTPEEFAAELSRLRAEAALTVREVSRRTKIPPATLGGYFSGRHLPPPTQPKVLVDVLRALGIVRPEDHEAWREALLRVRRTPGPRSRAASPYRGLEPFDIAHADLFFGREAEVAELLAEIGRLADRPAPRLLFVVGASGAGKSSLLRAGVLAALQGQDVATAVFAPGADPLTALGEATTGLAADAVVVVDQAEEIFAVEEAARGAFLTELLGLSQRVVLALRADFYAAALAEPALLAQLQGHTRLVGPLGPEGLARAITEPAVRAGGTVEPELVQQLRRDLAGRRTGDGVDPGVLPLLSHALLATWLRSRDGRLTVTDYVATGGIEGAIRQTAEDVYQGLDDAGRAAARGLFGQLVSLGDDLVPTRRRLRHEELTGYDDDLEAVIAAFVRGRILTAAEDSLDISHEALLVAWPRLAEWVDEDSDDLRIRRKVHEAARTWDEHGREPAGLMGGTLLSLAEGLSRRRVERGAPLPALETDFVRASAAAVQVQAASRRRRQRRTEMLLAVVAALALVTSVLAVFALTARSDAVHQRAAARAARDEALSRQVASQAERTAAVDPAAAAHLALAAYKVAPTVEARSALLDSTARPRVVRLRNPSGPMHAVPSPDGRTIAVACSDGRVRFWDRRTARVVATVSVGAGAELYAAAYSPDGRTFVAGGGNGTLAVYDVRDRTRPVRWAHQPAGPKTAVQTVAFSADGSMLAAATSDPSLLRWRVRGSALVPLPSVTGFGGSVQGVAFAPSGGVFATASSDGRVRIWRGTTLLATMRVGAATNYVNSVAFSPDGRLLAAGAKDKRVRVWDVRSPAAPRLVTDRLTGFTSWVNGVAFSPDGRLLVGTASGGLTRIWRVGSWATLRDIPAGSNNTAVAFTADSRAVVTSQLSGMAEVHALDSPLVQPYGDNIWSLTRPTGQDTLVAGVGAADPVVGFLSAPSDGTLRPLPHPLAGPASAGRFSGATAISPDGRTVFAATATGKVVVWRREGAGWRRVVVLDAAGQLFEGAAFSPDGSLFLATDDDGTVPVYRTGRSGVPQLRVRLDAKSGAVGLAVSPDDSLVAIGTFDRRVRIWHLDGSGPARLVATLGGFGNYVPTVAFSSDGRTLAAVAADGPIRRWRVDGTGFRPLGHSLTGPGGTVFSLAFTPDDSRLAAAAEDGKVWIWDRPAATTPTLWARLGALGAAAQATVFGPHGRWLAAAGAAGRVARWDVDVAAVARDICTSSGAPVSRAEWAQDAPGAPYRNPC